MRDDMARVIVERPRIPDRKARKGRSLPFDQLPAREGMRRPHLRSWGGKQLNENLAPLRRFLQSRAGRPWDKVRSEMSAVLSPRSAVQKHVFDHLKQMVEENAVLIDGRACHPPSRGVRGGEEIRAGRFFGDFYVCPRTGLLREGVREPRRKRRV